MPPSDRPKQEPKAERVPPVVQSIGPSAAPDARYRAVRGLNFTPPGGRDEMRIEPDEPVTDLPADAIAYLLADGDIEPWEAKEAREAAAAEASAQAALDALDDATDDPAIAALDEPVVAEDTPASPTGTTDSEEQ